MVEIILERDGYCAIQSSPQQSSPLNLKPKSSALSTTIGEIPLNFPTENLLRREGMATSATIFCPP